MNASDRVAMSKGGLTNRTDILRKKDGFELRQLKSKGCDRPQFAPELKNE
jgi:hypothetical protein